MKKLIKILSFVLILTLVFSTVCFAGETNDLNIKLELINELHGKDISEAEFLQTVFPEKYALLSDAMKSELEKRPATINDAGNQVKGSMSTRGGLGFVTFGFDKGNEEVDYSVEFFTYPALTCPQMFVQAYLYDTVEETYVAYSDNLVFDKDSCEASGTYDDPVSGRRYTLMGSVAVTYPPGTNPPIYSWSGSRTYTY